MINRPYLNSVVSKRQTPNSVFKDCTLDPYLMSSYMKKPITFQQDAKGLAPHDVEPKKLPKEEVQLSHFCVVHHQQFKEPQLFKKFMVAKNLHDVLQYINWGVRNDDDI